MTEEFENLIQAAKDALLAGDAGRARQLAEQCLINEPANNDAKLILAGLSQPEDGLRLLQDVLESDPNNPFVHKALQWAAEASRQKSAAQWAAVALPEVTEVEKNLEETAPIPLFKAVVASPVSEKVEKIDQVTEAKPEEAPKRKRSLLPNALVLLAALIAFVFYSVGIIRPRPVAGEQFLIKNDTAKLLKPSLTPTKTNIPTATPSPTATNTPEPSPTPTETPTATPTEEVIPTVVVEPIVLEPDPWENPDPWEEPEPLNGKWIDINLSSQTLSAYEDNTLVNSFIISSGRPGYETVAGTYYVYVKHLYADMAGPGYYLPDVPYVMYFYLGYGIHGTYWHDNFGTPMSAGCINMETGNAAWLYNWAFVGIPVSVHY